MISYQTEELTRKRIRKDTLKGCVNSLEGLQTVGVNNSLVSNFDTVCIAERLSENFLRPNSGNEISISLTRKESALVLA